MKLEVGRVYKRIYDGKTTYFKVIGEDDDAGVWYHISIFGGGNIELPATWFDDYDIRISNKSEVLLNSLDDW